MNPTDMDLLDLLIKRDSDGLSAEEADRLSAALENDPAAREAAVMHYMIRVGTKKAARAKAAALAERNRLRSRRVVWRMLPALAAAAALLILTGVWIANRTGADMRVAHTVLVLDEAEGDVQFVRDGRPVAARTGMRFRPGDGVRVLGAGQATLALTEQTGVSDRFLLADNAFATVAAAEPGLRIVLRSGRMEAHVEPRTAVPAWFIETAHARLTALGTRFLVATDSDVTRARVTEGVVELTRLSDGKTARIEAGHYAVATADQGRLPGGPYTPGMNVEGRVLFRETFERWNPEIWEAAYSDPTLEQVLPGNPVGQSVGVTSETRGHAASSHALDIRADGPVGSRTTVYAPLRNIRLPDSFVVEFDFLHVKPSLLAYLKIGGAVETLYAHPRANAIRSQSMRDRQWWRVRFETRLYQSEDGLWNAELTEYLNGARITHDRNTAIRHPEIFDGPLFLFFSVDSGHVKIANIVLHEWTPFDAEPAAPDPVIFRESFAQGWRPHVWQTGLFNPTTRQTRFENVFGRHIFVTKDTQDPNRSEALEIKGASDHIMLRVDPRLLRFPDRFVMEFDVFQHAPSDYAFLAICNLNESPETLYRNPRREHLQTQARQRKEWWTTRLEIECSQTPDGTRVADVKEYMNGERMLHKIFSGIRDQDSFTPPEIVLFVLESGHLMLDNIRVYADPSPETSLARDDRETAGGN